MQLLKNWRKVLPKIKEKTPILLLDYDGTLTPIVKRPDLANLSLKNRKTLKDLSVKFFVCIISGRKISDVRKKVGIKGIFYAGNHGFEVFGPSINKVFGGSRFSKKEASIIARKLKAKTKALKGILIEDKGITISMHYRLASRKNHQKAEKIFSAIVKPYVSAKKIRISHGKKVAEIRPNISWDKGRAALWFIKMLKKKHGLKKVLPIYLGDDTTDEDAFKALKKRGITVLVGTRKTAAEYSLRNVDKVYRFFQKIIYNVKCNEQKSKG